MLMRLLLWQFCEDTARPSIGVHNSLLDKHISTEPGHQDCPHNIVDSSRRKETQRNHTVQVVRKLVVNILACAWGHVRGNGKVDVGEHEEGSHGYSGADSRCPVWEILVLGEIDIEETGGYEDVDDRKRVGNQAVDFGQLGN